ncbi:hypothetical protein, partial [Rhodopirellula sallentina]|uniref:hypothetical protein n=1 Tax=Rhodopirellula sallentina TaxID=1263869 RepID=UPI001F22E024
RHFRLGRAVARLLVNEFVSPTVCNVPDSCRNRCGVVDGSGRSLATEESFARDVHKRVFTSADAFATMN